MKILVKNPSLQSTDTKRKFKQMSNSTAADREKIRNSLNAGWEYCDRETWKKECRDAK